ncbi:acyl-CoA N-acyltransferase [Chytridium lagenaria]|nr:acyl-CoA N-acyltransferase [Chytridium lagenaria]
MLNDKTAYAFKLYAFSELPETLFEWAFQLVKSNLYDHYVKAEDTGWTDRRKRKEMSERDGKYLIAFQSTNNTEFPVGFMYFQFLSEESYDAEDEKHGEVPVVYCLELQIEPSSQGHGLGSLFMKAMEKLGVAQGLTKAMLTVFKSNEKARSFYKKLG